MYKQSKNANNTHNSREMKNLRRNN